MFIVVLIVGLLAVRLLAHILIDMDPKIRAIISTVIAVLLGIWAASIDINEMEYGEGLLSSINVFFFAPSLYTVGSGLMAITLGWESDSGTWNEYFRIGDTSYGRTEGDLGLMGMIIWVFIAAAVISSVLFIINPIVVAVVYFVMHAFLFLKVVLHKD